MASSLSQHRDHLLHHAYRGRPYPTFQKLYSVAERLPLHGRPGKYSSLGGQVALRRRYDGMVFAALGEEVRNDKVEWESLTTPTEEQQQVGNIVEDEAVCWVNNILHDPMVEVDPVTILRRIVSEKQSRFIQQVQLSQAATPPPTIQSLGDGTNIAFVVISSSILIIMTALLQLQRLKKGGDRVGFAAGIASLIISAKWHDRLREVIKETLGALLVAVEIGKRSIASPKGSPELIDQNAGIPTVVTGTMQTSQPISAEQLTNDGIVVGMLGTENAEICPPDQDKEANYGQHELWANVDTGENGLLHTSLPCNHEPALRQMELESFVDGQQALMVKHQLSMIKSTEIEVEGHTNGVVSAIALEHGFAVLPHGSVTDQLLDLQNDESVGGIERNSKYKHFLDEDRTLISAQEKNSDLQIGQALQGHWSSEKVREQLSMGVLVSSALGDNNPCKTSNGRAEAWSGLGPPDDHKIDYLHNSTHGDMLIKAVDSSKGKLQPEEQEGETQETTLLDPISRNEGEEVNFVNDQGLDYMTGGEDLTDVDENSEEAAYTKAGEAPNGTFHELYYTDTQKQVSVGESLLDLPCKDEDAASTNSISNETIEESETYKVLGAALPAVAVGVGLVLGVAGGLQVVGFFSLATFISREILWADSRDSLWQELSSITDRQKLLEFLAKRNRVKRKQ